MGITTGSGGKQGLVGRRDVLGEVFPQVELIAGQLQQGGLGLPVGLDAGGEQFPVGDGDLEPFGVGLVCGTEGLTDMLGGGDHRLVADHAKFHDAAKYADGAGGEEGTGDFGHGGLPEMGGGDGSRGGDGD